MAKQTPCHAGEKSADHEGHDFVARGVDAHGLGGNFVVVNREESAPVGGVDHGEDDVNGHGGCAIGPKEIGVAGNSREAESAAEGGNVSKDDADDFTKTKGHDGEIVA